MKNKIARKLALYFAVVLVLLSVVIGVVFTLLFRNETITLHKDELTQRAASIAETLAVYMGSDASTGSPRSQGKNSAAGASGGYGAYIRMINDIALSDVWIVDSDRQLITKGIESGTGVSYADLPLDADKVIDQVFSGKTAISESFSTLLNAPTLTVGAPIISSDQTVIGAVLLHSPVNDTDKAVTEGLSIFGISLAAALAVSFVLSVILSDSFARPLKRMKDVALRMADGDFKATTGVRQKDEIGQLASAIDTLAVRLDESSREKKKLDEMKKDFVANISHELRTPVTVLMGSVEALRDGIISEPEQVKRYYDSMLSETKGLQRLVTDLLDLSRLQNTDFQIDREDLNLLDVLKDAVRSISRIADQKKVTVLLGGDEAPISVKGDYDRLRQMFIVVLDNAVKFSPEGGRVEVTCAGNAAPLVSIRDEGEGIPPEEVPYLFERFYKSKSPANKQGSGLGLAVAKQIAQRHGIAVSVASEPGKGSEFRFQFQT